MSEIMITLQQIRDHQPCKDGWMEVFRANRGDMTKPFPLKSIIDSNDLTDCLWALRCLPGHNNLWRLYAVWCARQVEHLMTDARSKAALDVAERFAKGDATQEELTAAWTTSDLSAACAACAASCDAAIAAKYACDASSDAAMLAARAAARAAAWSVSDTSTAGSAWSVARAAACDAQKAKLIEILNAGEWV